MRLWGLTFLCVSLCLGEHAVRDESLAHNVKQHEPKKSAIGTTFNVSGSLDLSFGDTLVMNCSVTRDKDKKVDTAKLQLVWTKPRDNSTMVLKTETASAGISYTLGPVTYEHMGVYSCIGDESNSDVYTTQHEFVWVKDPTAPVSLNVISLNRVKFFIKQTVTIGCTVPDGNTEWKIMRFDDVVGIIEECPGHIKKNNVVSCTIPTQTPAELVYTETATKLPYWCQSEMGQMSNVLNVSNSVRDLWFNRKTVWTIFTLTPGWYLRTGDSAVLDCSVYKDRHNNSNNMDLQLIWTQLSQEEEENNIKVLLSQSAPQGFNYTLVNVTHEHSGVYTCWDDGSQPNVSVYHKHHFIWVEDDTPPVTVTLLSHNRTQFFFKEEVTVGCQLPNDQSQWTIRWYDPIIRKLLECENPKLSLSRFLSCTMTMGFPSSERIFWCQSSTGERSTLLNTTSTPFDIILDAPVDPLTEGDDVTLRCWQKDERNQQMIPANAGFHVNNKFIGKSKKGTITFKVTKAHEGFHQCSTRAEGMGHKTWITVKGRV